MLNRVNFQIGSKFIRYDPTEYTEDQLTFYWSEAEYQEFLDQLKKFPSPFFIVRQIDYGGKRMDNIQYQNLTIRQAEVSDAKQLATWWNDGAVMAHAGFPHGIGTTEAEVIQGLNQGCLVIQENDRLIGECNYRNVDHGVAEIGIKICETDGQNRGVGRKILSMLIGWLFQNGYSKIILDTNLKNTRAQHVYESLGFRKVKTNIDAWKDQIGQLQSSIDYELMEKDFISFLSV